MNVARSLVPRTQTPWTVLLGIGLTIITLAGCSTDVTPRSTSLELADASARVVAVRMPSSLSAEPYSGISLGDGYLATSVPWVDYPSYCCAKEAPSESKFEAAAPGLSYSEVEMHGLEANRGWMLFKQVAFNPPATSATGSLRGGERVFLLGVVQPSASGDEAVTVREIVGVVNDGEAPLPGAQGTETFTVVRAPGWAGLRGGLVLDSRRRAAGMIRHFDPSTSGGLAYVTPLSDVINWATR